MRMENVGMCLTHRAHFKVQYKAAFYISQLILVIARKSITQHAPSISKNYKGWI